MSAKSETAAVYALASFAAEYVLTDSIWPAFLAWLNDLYAGQAPPMTADDRDHAEHLAKHLDEFAAKAMRLASIEEMAGRS